MQLPDMQSTTNAFPAVPNMGPRPVTRDVLRGLGQSHPGVNVLGATSQLTRVNIRQRKIEKDQGSELVIIPFVRDPKERRKKTNIAISHSMRVFRQQERQPERNRSDARHISTTLCPVIPSKPAWDDSLWDTQELDSVHRYMDQCYSFGIMRSLVRPVAASEPALYYALAWQCQCEINAITARDPLTHTSLLLRSRLLQSLSDKLSNPQAQNSWSTAMAVSLLSSSTSIASYGSDVEHSLHANAVLMLLGQTHQSSSKSTESLAILRPAVFQFCWYVEKALLGNMIDEHVPTTLRNYINRLERKVSGPSPKEHPFQCQNPLSCMGKEYSAAHLLSHSPRTIQLMEDTKTFLTMTLMPPDVQIEAAHRALAVQIMEYKPELNDANDTIDTILETCRLGAQITVQMAALGVPWYRTKGSARHVSLDGLIDSLSREMRKTDPIHLWGLSNSILFWILIVGACMSRGMPAYSLFKSLLYRLCATHIFSEYDDPGFILTLQNFVSYQASCEAKGPQFMRCVACADQ
ncbi:hypothetical protein BX600DRAFT_111964 [Xylariales sp. PMI_506]|nr:hypothetical protein BX600DRAFT_111964 [Xylariales sp. PMI_506]